MLVRPAPVMEQLRGKKVPLAQLKAASSEVRLQFKAGTAGETGIRLTDGKNHLEAFYDHAKQVMVLDLSGLDKEITKGIGKPDGPVSVKPGDLVTLRIFSDRSVFETYANDEIVISSQAFFHDPENLKAELFNRNGATTRITVDAWEMGSLMWSKYDPAKCQK
jgi:sucrose-6-phosphate hydrolase SacC (GH32 family)